MYGILPALDKICRQMWHVAMTLVAQRRLGEITCTHVWWPCDKPMSVEVSVYISSKHVVCWFVSWAVPGEFSLIRYAAPVVITELLHSHSSDLFHLNVGLAQNRILSFKLVHVHPLLIECGAGKVSVVAWMVPSCLWTTIHTTSSSCGRNYVEWAQLVALCMV